MPPHFHTMEGYSQCGQANQHLARDAAKSVVERNKQGLLGRRCPLYLIQGKRYAEVKRQHACGRNHHLQAPGYGHVHDGGHQDPQREHPVFWQTLAKLFTMPLQAVPYPAREHGWDGADLFRVNTYWSVALDEAGKCGNVLPFEVAPAQALARYVRSEEAHHPRVALWLYSKGLRTMDQLHAHVDTTYNIGGDHFGTLSHERPVSLEYVVDWCEVLLRDFNLGFAQKVGVAGQALMAFGHAAWKEHLEPVFRPYIHGIDMQLLYLVCHAIPNDEVDMHATLDRTVWLATQHPGTAFDSKRVDLYRRGHAWPNTGLGVLLEYMTPQTRVDLYFLARKVREGEQGIAPSNMLDLPALS